MYEQIRPYMFRYVYHELIYSVAIEYVNDSDFFFKIKIEADHDSSYDRILMNKSIHPD